ncbi:MAG: DNA polymerase III subunit delta [Prevotella sp.]|nr:DNA polymerase III subunit delta [Prevotella sp.]
MKFSEVIGQETARDRLLQMVDDGHLPHAVMLCGPQGCGKMALAMAFASYMLGERRGTGRQEQGKDTPQEAGPDNFMMMPVAAPKPSTANIEAMLDKMEHPDLHFTYPVIRPTGTSSEHKMVSSDFARQWNEMILESPYFTIDQWLERMDAANQQAQIGAGESDELTRKLSLKSSQGGYKVSIIWLPERMNQECSNKILKLLEEPPAKTVFIMVSEEPERLLETIRSRTQRIDIKRIDNDAIEEALVEKRGIDRDNAHRIARAANGSWDKALEALDSNNERHLFLEMFIQLMRKAYTRDVKEMKHWSEETASYGRERQKRMLTYFGHMIRENFIFNFRKPELNYMTEEEEQFSRNFAKYINEANVIEISELLARAQRDIAQNANAKIVFYDLALQMIVLLIKK